MADYQSGAYSRTVAMVLIDPALVAARARAALAYAAINVRDSTKRVGIHSSTMTRIVSPSNPRGASLEELWAIADACKVPRSFMERGFEALDEAETAARLDQVADELATLRLRVEAIDGGAGSP